LIYSPCVLAKNNKIIKGKWRIEKERNEKMKTFSTIDKSFVTLSTYRSLNRFELLPPPKTIISFFDS